MGPHVCRARLRVAGAIASRSTVNGVASRLSATSTSASSTSRRSIASCAAIGTLFFGTLMLVPSAAAATTIFFDDLPSGTEVTNQYERDGVIFGRSPRGPDDALTIYGDPGRARSGDRIGRINQGSPEFSRSSVWGQLLSPSRSLHVYVGAVGSGVHDFALDGYDISGALIASQRTSVFGGARIAAPLALLATSGSTAISYFNIRETAPSNAGAIDDLSFDGLVGPPQPDFALIPSDAGDVVLGPGQKRQLTMIVRRHAESAGPIALTATSTAAGVTPSLSPAQVSGVDGERITLTLQTAREVSSASGQISVAGTPLSAAAGSQPRTVSISVSVLAALDLRVKNIEVTQGVAPPGTLPRLIGAKRTRRNHGPELARGGKTIARVYVDVVGGPAGGVPNVGVQLSALDGDTFRTLAGGPVGPVGGPLRLGASALNYLTVSEDERANDTRAFSFVLPSGWTKRRRISLLATVREPVRAFAADAEYRQCTAATCYLNDHASLTDIRFVATRPGVVSVLELDTASDIGRLPGMSVVFAAPIAMTPGDVGVIGPLSVIRNRDKDLNQAVHEWWNASHPDVRGDYAMGIENLPTCAVTPECGGGQAWSVSPTAIASLGRPVTAVAHEWFHLLGRQHASDACGAGDPAVPNDTESWPPDNEGRMQGVALDRRGQYDGARPFRLIADKDPGSKAWDVMSYCPSGNELNNWASPRSWAGVLNRLKIQGAQRSLRRASVHAIGAASTVHVTARIGGQSATITGVARLERAPVDTQLLPAYAVIAFDAAGGELARAVASGGPASEGGELILQANLPPPAAAAARIELQRDGTTLASRTRSQPPQIQLRSPRGGSRVRAGRAVLVGWRSSDPDEDGLTARVEYSRDDGRSWTPVGMTAAEQSMRLQARLFGRSKQARVRVIVSDGWNEAVARSARFRADGTPPQVSIDAADRPTRVRADGTLDLTGRAQDDRFRELTRGALTWRAGRGVLQRGERLAMTGGLRPGRHTVTLEARDRYGRRGRASTTVNVLAVQPRFLTLRSPRTVARGARTVALQLQTNTAATLRIGHRRLTVDRRLRRVRVALPRPTTRQITIALRLQSGRLRSYQTVTLRRRP